jgi:hypothetical protein
MERITRQDWYYAGKIKCDQTASCEKEVKEQKIARWEKATSFLLARHLVEGN